MSFDKISQLVSSVTKTLANNEKLATPFLSNKLNKYADSLPHDQTIGMINRVIGDLIARNSLFITRAQFKDLYQKFYAHGTKFAELFQEELGQAPPEATVTVYNHDDSKIDNTYQVEDQVLANALQHVFDNQIPIKTFSQPLANQAIKSVAATLDAWGLRPTQLVVEGGNEKFLVVKAEYETPKGITSFYLPIEIQNKRVVEASIFMGNTGPQELNHTNIRSYLTTHAGNLLTVNATIILSTLTRASSENREISNAELAVTRLNAERQGKSEFFQNQVIGQKMSTASVADVKLPKYDEFESFEKQFSTAQGHAVWKFGKEKVTNANNHIARELSVLGYKNSQIVVTGNDNKTIFYGVYLDTGKAAFTVPVKIANNQLQKPTLILSNGIIATFDQDGINKLVSENRLDCKVAAAASTLSAMRPSEVINNLRQAITDGNHAKAEDALNVLANAKDDRAYATGFQIYMDGLAGHKKIQTSCSKMIKSAVSEYPICSHTGLPTNKVYQDKQGYCRPLFRQGMDETYEGAIFNNSKILG